MDGGKLHCLGRVPARMPVVVAGGGEERGVMMEFEGKEMIGEV